MIGQFGCPYPRPTSAPRGATPVRLPDLGRRRPSIRCDRFATLYSALRASPFAAAQGRPFGRSSTLRVVALLRSRTGPAPVRAFAGVRLTLSQLALE
jgi:hypothetical protein